MRLDWDGLLNARDLGGIPLRKGGQTIGGSYARSDHPLQLTTSGWNQAHAYGIRTIISLETAGLDGEAALRSNRPVILPDDFQAVVLRLAIEDATDQEFMKKWAETGLWGTPLYFAEALRKWPLLYGAAINAAAEAEGAVLLHCGRGHDRTGILTLLLLAIAGATPEAIAEDYLLSASNLRAREPRSVELLEAALSQSGTTAYEAISAAIALVDDVWLRQAQVWPASVAAIRARLVPGETATR